MVGLSKFQIECERTVRDVLDEAGLEIAQREVSGESEKFVHIALRASPVEVWIYDDEAAFSIGRRHYNFEGVVLGGDAATIREFSRALRARLARDKTR